ncbi:hypothetical protein BE20_25805 [Sorangium cellulosum]|uniref:Uncharacterized protein n=1 Tax=Sorangium cellulosum TaxID=56 RepID=A0A150S534_SORCE|nr:hypothetical protein BE20_25805 [Sorangium cellulosum]KYF88664.1 hypothetical protein BE18_14335 [Sorangium cellulosum]
MNVRTEEVFGIRSQLVLSYVERDDVDSRFKESLATDHHVVVYGSSKQGKTSLRQKHLPDEKCTIVRCGPRMSIETLYQSILRQAGATIKTIETQSIEGSVGLKAKIGFAAKLPLIGGSQAELEGSGNVKGQRQLTTEFVSHDFGDAQSIAELLEKLAFNKRVVLENYHYLPGPTQRALAFDLKTFHEVGIKFLILGIWKEANLLITHNGDLQDRVVEVPIEPWKNAHFNDIADVGSRCLNITIDSDHLARMRSSAYGNVGLFQELLKQYCLEGAIYERMHSPTVLSDGAALERAIRSKLESQRSALLKGFQGIAAKSRVRRGEGEEPLLLPYYLTQVVLSLPVTKLQEGIDRGYLLELLRAAHHRADKSTIRTGDVTNLLTNLPLYQADMSPPLFYYDANSKRLRVVDGRIFFVLSNDNQKELAEEIAYPDTEMPDDGDSDR